MVRVMVRARVRLRLRVSSVGARVRLAFHEQVALSGLGLG